MSGNATVVCYFSGTGNSLSIARRIAQGLDGAKTINIADMVDGSSIADANRLVVVFPVYIWGLPRIIRDFFENLKTGKNADIWVAAANGGLAGDPIGMINAIGKKKGFSLASGFLVWTPENFVVRYPMWSEWMNRIALESSRRKTDRIVARINAGKKGTFERSVFPINGFLSHLHFSIMKKIYVENAMPPKKLFWVTDACVGCGLCERICTKHNIALTDGKPVWGNDCEICVACLQWCPAKAIQAGNKTERRARYHNPEITVNDMIIR